MSEVIVYGRTNMRCFHCGKTQAEHTDADDKRCPMWNRYSLAARLPKDMQKQEAENE